MRQHGGRAPDLRPAPHERDLRHDQRGRREADQGGVLPPSGRTRNPRRRSGRPRRRRTARRRRERSDRASAARSARSARGPSPRAHDASQRRKRARSRSGCSKLIHDRRRARGKNDRRGVDAVAEAPADSGDRVAVAAGAPHGTFELEEETPAVLRMERKALRGGASVPSRASLGFRPPPRHRDLAGAHHLDQPVGAHDALESVDLVA